MLPAHYDVVGQALLATLEGGLGAEWNDQVRRAQCTPLPLSATTRLPIAFPTARRTGEGLMDRGVRHHRQDHDRRQLPGELVRPGAQRGSLHGDPRPLARCFVQKPGRGLAMEAPTSRKGRVGSE